MWKKAGWIITAGMTQEVTFEPVDGQINDLTTTPTVGRPNFLPVTSVSTVCFLPMIRRTFPLRMSPSSQGAGPLGTQALDRSPGIAEEATGHNHAVHFGWSFVDPGCANFL